MFEVNLFGKWSKKVHVARLCRPSSITGKMRASILFLILVFLVSSGLSSTVFVESAQAQKTKKSKKLTKVQKAKALRKVRAARKARATHRADALGKASAGSRVPRSQVAYKATLNQNTVTLMSGCCTTGAYTAFGADIKDMIKSAGDKNGLRVLPVLGGGGGTNVRDILYLRGIDMAILNMDVIDYFKDKPLYESLEKRIHYITRLFNEEVHLYAGNTVSSLIELNGKRVGFNNSSAEVTAFVLFEKLGIKPSETIRISEGDGALALKEGRLDAMMRVTGKPIRNVLRLKNIFPGIRLLPINYDPAFIGSHLPTQLTHEDYPELINKGQVVPTIATRTILAVFNWKLKSDRYRRLSKFTKVFFEHFAKLRSSQNLHPKWAEVNLRATVPGMTRFAPAQQWIDAKTTMVNRENKLSTALTPDAAAKRREQLMVNFKQFMATRGAVKDGGNSEQLFADFLAWQNQKR
ncbi:MAG: hypothetical protein GY927_15575 [bacterium]|nr:hypothetical protein [bacterium]